MRYILIALLSVFLPFTSAISQEKGKFEEIRKSDSTLIRNVTDSLGKVTHYCDSICGRSGDVNTIISPFTYRKVVDKYFTYLSYQRGTFPTGNSAAVTIADKTNELNLSLSKKVESKKSYQYSMLLFTTGIQAKVDQGIAQIFSGEKTTVGTSIFGNFAYLLPSHKRIKTIVSSFKPHQTQPKTAFQILESKREILKTKFCNTYKLDSIKYKCMIDRLNEIDATLIQQIDCKTFNQITKERDEILRSFSSLGLIDKTTKEIIDSMDGAYKNAIYELETKNPVWEWMRLSWISGGISYTHSSYDVYDSSKSLPKRFAKSDFESISYKLTINWFRQRALQKGLVRSHYFNIGYEPKQIDNYASIQSQSIVRNIYAYNSADTQIFFQVNKTAKDVSGIKYKSGWRHTLSSNYTAMIGKGNFGLNFHGEVQFSPFSAPLYSSHIGSLFRFVNSAFDPTDKNSKAKVNFEIFIEFQDMTDVGKSNKSLWQNKSIGINTNVPFEKIFFK